MKNLMTRLRRPLFLASAFVLAAGLTVPAIVSAATPGQVQTRSVMMSDSTPSATGVKYTVKFNVATTGVIQGVDIDFCGGGASDTPLIGDSNCTLPTGMSLTGVSVTNVAGLNPTTGWTATVLANGHTVEVSNASGASVSSPTTVSFDLNGIKNPSSTPVTNSPNTFFARMTTFSSSTTAGNYTSGTPGSYVDYGGAALAVGQAVQVTAKVMETLTFCVSGSTITSCSSGLTPPSVNLGRSVGSNYILDSAAVYTANAYTQISTNATQGATVRMSTTSSSTCAGLSSDGGATCTNIPAVASGATTVKTITAGSAAFGMCVTAGSANTVAQLPYNSPSCTQYGMDDSSGTKATSTYGSPIFTTNGNTANQENDTLKYAATASNTTPAGIYTTTQSLIATGTF